MHIKRNVGLPAIGAAVVVASWADGARSEEELFAALDMERQHAVYLSSGTAVHENAAHAVVVNQWTRPLRISPICPKSSRGSLKMQAASALRELDEHIDSIGAERADILELNAFTHGRGANAGDVHDLVLRYLDERASSFRSFADFHGRALHGVFEVEDWGHVGDVECDVALVATILDPRTATSDKRADMAWGYQRQAERRFLIGPAHADAGETGTSGRHADGRVAVKAALSQVRLLLTEMGAEPADVDELTVYFDRAAGIREADLRGEIDDFIPGGAPLVDYVWPRVRYVPARAVAPAAGAVSIQLSGTVTHYR